MLFWWVYKSSLFCRKLVIKQLDISLVYTCIIVFQNIFKGKRIDTFSKWSYFGYEYRRKAHSPLGYYFAWTRLNVFRRQKWCLVWHTQYIFVSMSIRSLSYLNCLYLNINRWWELFFIKYWCLIWNNDVKYLVFIMKIY